MIEIGSAILSLVTLGLAFGVFVLPSLQRSHQCLFGLSLGAAGMLFLSSASVVAWPLIAMGSAIFSVGVASESMQSPSTDGWHNWFAIVVTASALWLLSLFLLWTVEEALALPSEVLAGAPEILEVVSAFFDRYLWVLALLLLFAATMLFAVPGGNE